MKIDNLSAPEILATIELPKQLIEDFSEWTAKNPKKMTLSGLNAWLSAGHSQWSQNYYWAVGGLGGGGIGSGISGSQQGQQHQLSTTSQQQLQQQQMQQNNAGVQHQLQQQAANQNAGAFTQAAIQQMNQAYYKMGITMSYYWCDYEEATQELKNRLAALPEFEKAILGIEI